MNELIAALKALRELSEPDDILLCQCEFWRAPLFVTWKRGSWGWRPIAISSFSPRDAKFDFLVHSSGRPMAREQGYFLYRSEHLNIVSTKTELGHRFSTAKADVSELLKLARQTGQFYLSGELKAENLPSLTSALNFEVCVAFWKDGQVRGSMMAEGVTLKEAVKKGTIRALNDSRWKPLSIAEWERVQIELTIFSPLKLPVRKITEQIDYTKGYMARHQGRLGLYVPEVFNAVRFRNKTEFLRSLVRDKAGISPADIRRAKFVEFDVMDVVESPNGQYIELQATMPMPRSDRGNLKEVETTALKAIEHLMTVQEPDGNLPPISQPLAKGFSQFDFGRLAFVLFALVEWNRYRPTDSSKRVSEGILTYIQQYLDQSQVFENLHVQNLYALAYLGHAYQAMGYLDQVTDILKLLRSHIDRFPFEPILSLEAISLNNRASTKMDFSVLEAICRSRFDEFAEYSTTDAASWAEAVVAFQEIDPPFADRVANWLLNHQTPVGYFKQSADRDFGYTRGTAKVFEVLATNPSRYAPALQSAQAWLHSMQYDESNMFFISPDFRKFVAGGFRHDYNNSDVWIDAAGHYILGATRILSSTSSHDSQ